MSLAPRVYPMAIVGAGALGLSIAARLSALMPVAVVASSAGRAEALRCGVEVGGARFHFDVYPPEHVPQAEWVLVLVKASATLAAARTATAMQPNGVLSLQNGLLDELLRAGCGDGVLAAQGVTTMGAYREGDRVVPVNVGDTLMPAGFELLAERFQAAGLPSRVDAAIEAARLAKLLVNLALNPLTAVFRVNTGALLDPPFIAYVDALVAEAWPVLRLGGLALDQAAAREKVQAVIRSTAGNRTSMLQDVLAGRRTELDAITGAFLRLADRAGASVPTHRALHALLSLGQPPG